ncbi:MAG TPA: metallophosphoesterase [Pyrinomonadaceae bacterium]|nr:metallophosphoesterase [Pyrinomonadaceae bacterium]
MLGLLLVAVGCCLAAWAFLIEPNRLVIHEETISLSNWPRNLDGLRVAALADFHAGSPFVDEQKLRRIVLETNQTSPDLIVLLGDFMIDPGLHKPRIEPEIIAGILKDFRARFGVYAVLGNHDWGYNGYRVRKALESTGVIKVLENEVAQIDVNGGSLWLAGLVDKWTRIQDVDGTLRKIPAGQTVIALTHNPDIFPMIPPSVSLTLAGHTHGGQVNFPFVGRLIVPSDYGQKYAAGLIVEQGKPLFVTTGIGISIFPVRFRVPPEIAILTLKSK